LPALRDRKEDIPLLADYFLKKINLKTGKKISGFSQKVIHAMSENAWPGNIRELENMIERSILTAKTVPSEKWIYRRFLSKKWLIRFF
jgi:formate hydrogenlyase transcriptional activator